MLNKKIIFVLLLIMIITLCKPTKASAFWWFNQTPKVENQNVIDSNILSDKAKIEISNKYKIWQESFEKKNIDSVIKNNDKFNFTIPELNYLLENESKKVANPSITNVTINNGQDGLKVSADLHKFVNGRFSFNMNIISVENKIRLELSSVSLYGIPIKPKWLADPVNKAIDEYFSFIYKDKRYQGFSFTNKDNVLKLKFNFKK